MPPGAINAHANAQLAQSPVLLWYARTRPSIVTMPPGTEAPAPPPTNPTTSNVRPGTITNKGQPYWVRSTPRTTTPSAKMPTTTRTTPRAALEPPPRGRTGEGEVVKGGGAAVITAVGEAGSAGSAGSAFSTGTSAASGGASGR